MGGDLNIIPHIENPLSKTMCDQQASFSAFFSPLQLPFLVPHFLSVCVCVCVYSHTHTWLFSGKSEYILDDLGAGVIV